MGFEWDAGKTEDRALGEVDWRDIGKQTGSLIDTRFNLIDAVSDENNTRKSSMLIADDLVSGGKVCGSWKGEIGDWSRRGEERHLESLISSTYLMEACRYGTVPYLQPFSWPAQTPTLWDGLETQSPPPVTQAVFCSFRNPSIAQSHR